MISFVLALPLAAVVGSMIEQHLGASATASSVYEGTSYEWWEVFATQAAGLGVTFTPGIIGFAAVLENISRLLDNQPFAAPIAGATLAWMVCWSFLSGGILGRDARRRPTRSYGFFSACGRHFWRFLRLGGVAVCGSLLLFGAIHPWIFETGYGGATRDMAGERRGFAIRLAGYVVSSAFLASFALLLDYARVRLVVEDRRSALGSLVAGTRFLAWHGRHAGTLFLLDAAALALLVSGYAILAPGAPRAGPHMWLVAALGQELCHRAPLPEAARLCIGNSAVPSGPGSRAVYCESGADLARLAGDRIHHERGAGADPLSGLSI